LLVRNAKNHENFVKQGEERGKGKRKKVTEKRIYQRIVIERNCQADLMMSAHSSET